MTICTYCGEDVGGEPCRSTRDMEDRIGGDHPAGVSHAVKECFAALMILGGGEQTENQRKAKAYRRLIGPRVTAAGPAWDKFA